jgi:hypothetical protein
MWTKVFRSHHPVRAALVSFCEPDDDHIRATYHDPVNGYGALWIARKRYANMP